MPNQTLTINNADGSSETYTINRDKFEGVRSLSVDGVTVSVDHTVPEDIRTLTVNGTEITINSPSSRPDQVNLRISERFADFTSDGVLLFGICGQSNASGYADVPDAGSRFDSLVGSPRIYNRASSGSLEDFNFGVNQNLSSTSVLRFGPESELLRRASSTGQEVVVVKYAIGGSSLYSNWDSEVGGTFYNNFVSDYNNTVDLLEAEGKTVIHKGILFAQGETDAQNNLGGGVDSYYETKLTALVNNLRADLSVPTLPIVLTSTTSRKENVHTHTAEVNAAKANVASNDVNTFVIDSSNYSFKSDNIHYDSEGQTEHGKDFHQVVSDYSVESTYTITNRIVNSELVGDTAIALSLTDLTDSGGDNNVVKVRRSTDGISKDFTINELSTITSWVGAGNDGFVEIWYDQSGKDNHAFQDDPANQPKIVESGVFLGEVTFNSPADYLFLSDETAVTSGDLYMVMDTTDTQFSLLGSLNGPSIFLPTARKNDTLAQSYIGVTVGQLYVNGVASNPNTRGDMWQALGDGNLNLVNFNDLSTTSDLKLGQIGRGGNTNAWGVSGGIKEVILYTSDQSANRNKIEETINTKYGI